MGYTDFSVSNEWLDRYKKRNNVVSKTLHGEGGAADCEAALNWSNHRLAELQKINSDRYIFKLDEAALFYNMLPRRTNTTKGDASAGAKQRKHRIMILFGANATGEEKLPFLVIGKSKNPVCFQNARLLKDVIYSCNLRGLRPRSRP
ncbi:tigger transposable element-derived protein 4-like [Ornithodoros turicata]|uniref:tigger transposable element-derived protein 4-like n=1 Tax=Ornithodoros turicata TaxID=34597 RepID=UPI003139DD6B